MLAKFKNRRNRSHSIQFLIIIFLVDTIILSQVFDFLIKKINPVIEILTEYKYLTE